MERKTRQQTIIANILKESPCPLTPADILEQAQKEIPHLGIATVYRTLKKLITSQKVTLVEIAGAAPHYESSEKNHHHHFFCRSCDKVFDLEGCLSGINKIAPPEFQVESHEITLYGLCSQCTKTKKT